MMGEGARRVGEKRTICKNKADASFGYTLYITTILYDCIFT